ncbi:MAG: HAMP domain-containing protein [Chloroflexi bacterium]|nr:HAMP domain-containing protein [Chloroflexota bacterium]
MIFFKSVKFRLTVWYLAVIVALLLVFGGVSYFLLSQNLHRSLEGALRNRVTSLQTGLEVGGGRVTFVEQPNELVLVYSATGALLQRSGPAMELTGIEGLVEQALAGRNSFSTLAARGGEEVRFHSATVNFGFGNRIAILVGRPTTEIKNVLRTFRYVEGFSGLTVLLLVGVGGLFLAGRTLRPVDRITRTAQEIGESDLSRRINVAGEDELGRLASTLNRMIERLEAAFNRQRQFTADASHELRTPLAVMQAESTLALSKERTESEYRKSLELVSLESGYMSSLIDKLLFLARADAGKEPLELEKVNMTGLLEELSADVEALAREKGPQFKLGPLEDATVRGDRVKLRQLLLNLLENAVRYTPGGGSISATVATEGDMAVVTVSDTGIGISAEHLPHIFERFYRVDKARSRADGGAGLGLAIARYIAEVHGGRIEVESEPGKGSAFRVMLPLGKTDAAVQ